MIDFATLQGLTIPEGVVTQIAIDGTVVWKLQSATNEPPVILEVAKQTKTTYAGETKYENEEFILFDIYPKKGGTVNVTYGGLTKTITDTSGAEEPNAQQVFFGTFNGVSDSVATPTSGTLTIEGAYRGYGLGAYSMTSGKPPSAYASCVTNVIDFGNPVYIGDNTFQGCSNFALTSLPSGLTYIGNNAFYGCSNLALTSLPSGLTYIGNNAFHYCRKVYIQTFPEGLTHIGSEAFYMEKSGSVHTNMYNINITLPSSLIKIGNRAFATNETSSDGSQHYGYLRGVNILATTPPTIGEELFGSYGASNAFVVTVPTGCGETYKVAEGWSEYSSYITEGI